MPMSTFCKINSKIILINCLILFFSFLSGLRGGESFFLNYRELFVILFLYYIFMTYSTSLLFPKNYKKTTIEWTDVVKFYLRIYLINPIISVCAIIIGTFIGYKISTDNSIDFFQFIHCEHSFMYLLSFVLLVLIIQTVFICIKQVAKISNLITLLFTGIIPLIQVALYFYFVIIENNYHIFQSNAFIITELILIFLFLLLSVFLFVKKRYDYVQLKE